MATRKDPVELLANELLQVDSDLKKMHLVEKLRTKFMPIPKMNCKSCGNRLVFRWPDKILDCTKCGLLYELVITAETKNISRIA